MPTSHIFQVQRIRTDPHSPSRYRVDGTVRNMPEFAKAFKCSKKAKVSRKKVDSNCKSENGLLIAESSNRRTVYILVLDFGAVVG